MYQPVHDRASDVFFDASAPAADPLRKRQSGPDALASLAWLLDRRLAGLQGGEGREWLGCLRLKALVALVRWEHLAPQALSRWSLADAERLVLAYLNGDEQRPHFRLEQGPVREVLDWISAAGIRGGPVFRRIAPDGRVLACALTHAGISSLLSTLLAEGHRMGVVDRRFSLNLLSGLTFVA